MVRKITIFLLKFPMYLLIIVSLIASIYAAIKGIQGINFATPIILAIIIILYILGKIQEKKSNSNNSY